VKTVLLTLFFIFAQAEFLVGVGGYDCCEENNIYKNYDEKCEINCNISDYLKKEAPNVNAVSIWITKNFDFDNWFNPEDINNNIVKKGYTPIFIVYWYGDDISQDFVKNNKKEYFEFIRKVHDYITKVDGKKYIILNPEFNQNGVENWSGFNDYLIKSYEILKTSDREIGIGIGDFGIYNTTFDTYNWETFDKSINQSIERFDFISFQEMRATSRNSENEIKNTPYRSLELARYLHKKYKKPTFLAYLAISSYESNSQEFVYKRYSQLIEIFKKEANLIGFNTFHFWDRPQQVGYFNEHEKYFGILDKDGNKKRSFFWFLDIR
jgi:hypothetical protein